MNKCHFLYHKAGKVAIKLNQDLIIISNNIIIPINHTASDTKLGRAYGIQTANKHTSIFLNS